MTMILDGISPPAQTVGRGTELDVLEDVTLEDATSWDVLEEIEDVRLMTVLEDD